MIPKLIDQALILPSLAAETKDAALDEILAEVIASGRVPEASLGRLRRRLRDREKLGSTGIGNGVAVPHVKIPDADTAVLALARSVGGIEFQAVDGRVVHLVFLIIAPESAAQEHLVMLRWVSKLARSADFRRFAVAASDVDELRDLLVEMSEPA